MIMLVKIMVKIVDVIRYINDKSDCDFDIIHNVGDKNDVDIIRNIDDKVIVILILFRILVTRVMMSMILVKVMTRVMVILI